MAAYLEMPCQELVELITDYLERTLSEVDGLRFEQHLAECRHCRTYLLQMRQTILASGKLPEETVPEEVKSQLLRALRDWKARRQRA
jgi:anti-sigma factor RsiW